MVTRSDFILCFIVKEFACTQSQFTRNTSVIKCNKVTELWCNTEQWVVMKTDIDVNFTKSIKFLGYHEMDTIVI